MFKHTDRRSLIANLRSIIVSTRAMILAWIIIIAGITASAWAWLAPATKAEPIGLPAKVEAVSVALPQGNSAREQVETEIITIRPTGFELSQITRPAGPFFLTLNNRSGLQSFTFRLESQSGTRLQQVRVPREDLDWTGVVNLPPGRYTVTEINHPNWVCRITIR